MKIPQKKYLNLYYTGYFNRIPFNKAKRIP